MKMRTKLCDAFLSFLVFLRALKQVTTQNSQQKKINKKNLHSLGILGLPATSFSCSKSNTLFAGNRLFFFFLLFFYFVLCRWDTQANRHERWVTSHRLNTWPISQHIYTDTQNESTCPGVGGIHKPYIDSASEKVE